MYLVFVFLLFSGHTECIVTEDVDIRGGQESRIYRVVCARLEHYSISTRVLSKSSFEYAFVHDSSFEN